MSADGQQAKSLIYQCLSWRQWKSMLINPIRAENDYLFSMFSTTYMTVEKNVCVGNKQACIYC
jgi:hypothetical protein